MGGHAAVVDVVVWSSPHGRVATRAGAGADIDANASNSASARDTQSQTAAAQRRTQPAENTALAAPGPAPLPAYVRAAAGSVCAEMLQRKILYRKCVHGDYPLYTRLADKFAVRSYVAARIGEAHLVPLLMDSTDPHELLQLPRWRQTVIKANHGAAMVQVVRDEPDAVQKRRIIERCGQWLRIDFSEMVREIHYRDIPPRILVERYIGEAQQVPVDYKFHMFRQADGNFHYVLQVIYGRFDTPKLAMTFFVDNLHTAFHRIRDDGRTPPCAPALLEQALELSKVLASDCDYVRVDWYIQRGKIYFGELTFTPGAGLVTGLARGLDRMMGDMWVQRRMPVEPWFSGEGIRVRVPVR